jgi:glycosyltransferase involved in cell wall biosynthesis
MPAFELGTEGRRQLEKWIALLGRRDTPTDGVEDYCTFLGRALSKRGVTFRQVRVPWFEEGRIRALRELSRECLAWRGQWVVLQYTALGWSRRGFPFLALAVLRRLRHSGMRTAVMFHEPYRQGERWPRLIDRIRGRIQDWVIRALYNEADKCVFADPLETIAWLPRDDQKSAFIPIGANIPARANHSLPQAGTEQGKTVIVFGVTGAPQTTAEVEEIADVMREASRAVGKLRLMVIGRGAVEARDLLANALGKCDVELIVRGVLPAEEVAQEFERADVLLFVRGAITPRRSSAIAGIACGIPVIGYRNGEIGGLLEEAGVEWSPWRDRDALIRGLVRVLSDPQRWTELRERNLRLQENHLSWERIAEHYQRVLAE